MSGKGGPKSVFPLTERSVNSGAVVVTNPQVSLTWGLGGIGHRNFLSCYCSSSLQSTERGGHGEEFSCWTKKWGHGRWTMWGNEKTRF